MCLDWCPAGFTPSALGGPKLCAATSISTSQPNCISNTKFQQKTHNHPQTAYVFRLLASFPHKSLNLSTSHVLFHSPATRFAPLCVIRCLFNTAEEGSGQRDILMGRVEREVLTDWFQAAAFPVTYTTYVSVLSLRAKKHHGQSMWNLLSASWYQRPTENHCTDNRA